MPIWLRKFTFNKIKEYYDNQEKQNSKTSTKKTLHPDIDPTYTSKPSKK